GPRQLLGFTQSRRRRPGFVTIYTKTRSIYRFPVLKPLRSRTNTTYTNKTNIQVTKDTKWHEEVQEQDISSSAVTNPLAGNFQLQRRHLATIFKTVYSFAYRRVPSCPSCLRGET